MTLSFRCINFHKQLAIAEEAQYRTDYKGCDDASLPEVVDEVLEQVHHVARHVVEGDGRVTAARRAVRLGVGMCY